VGSSGLRLQLVAVSLEVVPPKALKGKAACSAQPTIPQIKSNNRFLVSLAQDSHLVLQAAPCRPIKVPQAYSVSRLPNRTQVVACSGQLEALPPRHQLVAVFLATLNKILQYNHSLEWQRPPRVLRHQAEVSSGLQARPRVVSLGNLNRTRSLVRQQANQVAASLGLNQLWAYRSKRQGFSAKANIHKTINNNRTSASRKEVSSSQGNRALRASSAMPRLLASHSTAYRRHLVWEALPPASHR